MNHFFVLRISILKGTPESPAFFFVPNSTYKHIQATSIIALM